MSLISNFFLEKKVTKIQGLIKMLAFLPRRYLSRQPRHDAFVDGLAFGVAGVWLRSYPSHAYLLQEPLAHFYHAGLSDVSLCLGRLQILSDRGSALFIPAFAASERERRCEPRLFSGFVLFL
jgi:hypothetical protein